MKFFHRITALLLAGVMALGLAACSSVTPEDAETYIQGLLDASYLGQYDPEYLELADITEEEAREEDYEWNTAAEAEILREYLAIQSTDASIQKSVDLIKEIYSHSKYSVTGASKLEDGSYAVTVSIQPMDILIRYQNQTDVNEIWMTVLAEHGVMDQAALDAMSDEEYMALEDIYAAAVLDGIQALVPEMGYGPEQSVVLQLQLEGDTYTLVGTDWQHLDSMMIDYSGQYCDLSVTGQETAAA
ncbi:MAG TPA: hypothetical protein H9703_02635 [Candidatus Faecalibacterium faecigallinarum]|uniref:DUF5105 domain-containing protein n=1 Tax=Candidatus Faecalibacterium faecigallinarum TaxID=2838577 RepID=A0A9D2T2T5_9FIRM|nr:hypothetical protein [Candidatus Faecalibacterium faecigallinarum]